jgi:hypothetical protein
MISGNTAEEWKPNKNLHMPPQTATSVISLTLSYFFFFNAISRGDYIIIEVIVINSYPCQSINCSDFLSLRGCTFIKILFHIMASYTLTRDISTPISTPVMIAPVANNAPHISVPNVIVDYTEPEGQESKAVPGFSARIISLTPTPSPWRLLGVGI